MRFTQTSDYLGLLPWLLLPLPLIFRRDRYTWFLTFLMAATLVMALGKYTFVYRFMFEHLPAFSKFRVPKMILFLFAFGAAVLAGRGMDVLADETVDRKRLGRWLWWCAGVTALIGLICCSSVRWRSSRSWMPWRSSSPRRRAIRTVRNWFGERFDHMFRDGMISFGMAALYLAAIVAWFRKVLPTRLFLPLLILLALCDLWRVNSRFLVVAPPPAARNRKLPRTMSSPFSSRVSTITACSR